MIEQVYLVISTLVVVIGMSIIVMALRAYDETSHRAMLHVAIGFTLIIAAATATAISAVFRDFYGIVSILVVNNGMTILGYIFLIYSVIVYD